MSHNNDKGAPETSGPTPEKNENGASLRMLLHEMRNAAQCCQAEIDAFALMGAFFEYLPQAAWIKTRRADGAWMMLRINHAFTDATGITQAAYMGADPLLYWESVGSPAAMIDADEWDAQVMRQHRGVAASLVLPDRRDPSKRMLWQGFKWPILKEGKVVAICGVADVSEVCG